jgi:hypothetical protein
MKILKKNLFLEVMELMENHKKNKNFFVGCNGERKLTIFFFFCRQLCRRL